MAASCWKASRRWFATAAGAPSFSPATSTAFGALTNARSLDPAQDSPDEFFGVTTVHTFELTIATADFDKMPPPSGRGPGRYEFS